MSASASSTTSGGNDTAALAATVTKEDEDEPLFNVLTCTPAQLATHLLRHRFDHQIAPAQDFWNQVQQQWKSTTTAAAADNDNNGPDLGSRLDHIPPLPVSCMVPRCGKVLLHLYEQGVQAVKQADPTTIVWTWTDWTALQEVLLLAKPTDLQQQKKIVTPVALLHGSAPLVTFRNKPYSQMCIMLPSLAKDQVAQPEHEGLTPEVWAFVQQLASLASCPLINVYSSSKTSTQSAFTSFREPGTSSTTAGLPFVACHLGTQDGVLMPLECGLVFGWKYWPRACLHSVAAGRGSGGSSRYIDVQVQYASANNDNEELERLEFTNINRSELPGLNQYIHGVLIPAMQRDANGGNNDNHQEDPEKDDNDSDDDDENVVIVNSDDDETDDEEEEHVVIVNSDDEDDDATPDEAPPSRRRGAKRKASQYAQEMIGKRVAAATSFADVDGDDYDEDEDDDFEQDNDDDEEEDEPSDQDDDKDSVVVEEPPPDDEDTDSEEDEE
mmetsp:Transcript_40400/g.84071  ORF Transcript_40400/g.84071 Transcript_40400/m.84071 type:complete len:497 (-) Transcript_40400:57-1547(-)